MKGLDLQLDSQSMNNWDLFGYLPHYEFSLNGFSVYILRIYFHVHDEGVIIAFIYWGLTVHQALFHLHHLWVIIAVN